MARRTRHEALITALLARRPMASRYAPRERDAEGRTWYRIENRAENAAGPVEVFIYSEIGMWGISADMFLDALAPIGARDITLRINSEGGEVFDGVAIFNALQRHGGRINAHVDGLAASAASFIAMAADEIVMEPGSQMMIHDAQGMCFGDEREMEKMRDMLARTSDTIAMIYAERAGGDPAAWREVMRGEQWYDGAAAVAAKLADRVGEGRPRGQGDGQKTPENRVEAGQGLPVNGPAKDPVTDYYGEAPGERDSDGRFKDGMPDVIAEYAIPALVGQLTARRTRGGVELSDGTETGTVTLNDRESDRLIRAMRNDYAEAETLITRHTEIDGKLHSVVIARVRPQGRGENDNGESVSAGMRLDLGQVEDGDDYDGRQGVVLSSAQADRAFGDAVGNAQVAARVETGYGPLDMYPAAGGGMGMRMKGDDGKPIDVEFTKSEWQRINRAINTVLDGFDSYADDVDDDTPEINKITVKTRAGKVDIEYRGPRQDRGYPSDARLAITPQDDTASWSVVIGGEHMAAAFDPIGFINDAIGIDNRADRSALPIAWADAAPVIEPDADTWASALIALTTPVPVSSRVDDHPMAFWEASA